MLSFPSSLKVYVAVEPCDMRKGFSGLLALAEQKLGGDVRTGALFAFTNRRRTRLKILFFDGTGLLVLAKRLERGTFSWPVPGVAGAAKIHLAPEALTLLMDGVDMRGAKMRPWYERG